MSRNSLLILSRHLETRTNEVCRFGAGTAQICGYQALADRERMACCNDACRPSDQKHADVGSDGERGEVLRAGVEYPEVVSAAGCAIEIHIRRRERPRTA